MFPMIFTELEMLNSALNLLQSLFWKGKRSMLIPEWTVLTMFLFFISGSVKVLIALDTQRIRLTLLWLYLSFENSVCLIAKSTLLLTTIGVLFPYNIADRTANECACESCVWIISIFLKSQIDFTFLGN